MKISLLVLTLMVSGSVFAGNSCNTCGTPPTSTSPVATSNVNTTSASVADAANAGNTQSVTFISPGETSSTVSQTVSGTTTQNVNYGGTQTTKNVPGISTAPLVSSNDTCMGSTTGGIAVPGFGLSIGSTWTDKNCTMLKNSREFWNMGMRAAAMARMCMDPDNKESLEETGFTCPTKKDKK